MRAIGPALKHDLGGAMGEVVALVVYVREAWWTRYGRGIAAVTEVKNVGQNRTPLLSKCK